MSQQTLFSFFKRLIIYGLFWLPSLAFAISPEIEVVDDEGTSIVTDVTTIDFKTATEKTFTVKNIGDGDLVLTSAVAFIHGGDGFEITDAFATPTTVAPNTAVTFNVVLAATTKDLYSGTLAFDHTDSNESPFSFAIRATIGVDDKCDSDHLNGCLTEMDCVNAGAVYVSEQCYAVNALIHSEKGRSVALDAKAHQEWDQPAEFAAGTAIATGLFLNNIEVTEEQTITWAGHLKVDPAHVGRQAEILFAIGIEPSSVKDPLGYSGDEDTVYYAFDGTLERFFPVNLYASAKEWPTELAKLTATPFKEKIRLPDQLSLELWTGKLNDLTEESRARFYTFFGYVLTDGSEKGTILYNGMPVMTTLK